MKCVEWGVKLATMMGREVATIEEARTQLKAHLKNRIMFAKDTFKNKH